MSVKSVYQPEPSFTDDIVRITGDEHRHLLVSRTQKDEPLEIFDGRGNVWTAHVLSVSRRETLARLRNFRRVQAAGPELILAQALIRTSAFELALEKVVEVGVTRIIPFAAARSNVAPGKRHERWTRIIVEAAKQSRRYHLPQLDPPATFDRVLAVPAGSKILFAERGGGPLKSALVGEPVLYMVGPEGGWTDAELQKACDETIRSRRSSSNCSRKKDSLRPTSSLFFWL